MRMHRFGVIQMNRSIGLSNTALNFKEFVVAAAVVMSRSFQAGAVLPIFHQALVRQWKQIYGHAAMLLNGWMLGGTYKTNGMNYIWLEWTGKDACRIHRSLTFDFWCSTQIWHMYSITSIYQYINISVYQQCRSCTPTLHYLRCIHFMKTSAQPWPL